MEHQPTSAIPLFILSPDGRLQPSPLRARSLAELGSMTPPGIYTISRSFPGLKAVRLDAHLARLEESARMIGMPMLYTRAILRGGLRKLLTAAGFEQARFRIAIPKDNPDCAELAAEKLMPVPPELKEHGVSAASYLISRPDPRAKLTIWMKMRSEARRHLPHAIYEGIIRNESGELLEGFSSNFFAVIGERIQTAGEGVLQGVARSIVLEITQDFVPVERRPPRQAEIADMTEAFLTSSSRGVVPIVRLDGQEIGDGRPGPITRQIAQRYDDWVARHLEPI